jgi:hypothetical protein
MFVVADEGEPILPVMLKQKPEMSDHYQGGE